MLGCVTLVCSLAADARAQAATVLVVYNTRSKDSVALADYYASKRGIPAANRCPISISADTGYFIDYASYRTGVKAPVQACLAKLGPGAITAIVLMYQTPFKIYDNYFTGAVRSIDSLLAGMWWPSGDRSWTPNPYGSNDRSAANAYAPFIMLSAFRATNPALPPVYTVWRLDGPSPAVAKAQIDNALLAEAQGLSGVGCFDSRGYDLKTDTGYDAGDWDVLRAAQLFAAAGFQTIVDRHDAEFGTPPAPLRCAPAAFFIGWYGGGHPDAAITWAPGAIGWHYDSLSLTSPRASDSWAGLAIAKGVTVTTGAIGEPYLNALPHADGFLRDLLQGANVGDAMLRSTEWLNWMIVNVGDPLYRPFPMGRPHAISTALPTFATPAPMPTAATPPAALPPPPTAAAFVRTDTTTRGTWKTSYGRDGYLLAVENDPPDASLGSWARITPAGTSLWTWAPSTQDVRALQRATGTTRIAATWYTNSFSFDVSFTDGATHQLALYVVDWDASERVERIDLLDVGGAMLDSRSVSDFAAGRYLVWNVKGRVTVRVTRTAGPNAVVSGVFLDPAAGSGSRR